MALASLSCVACAPSPTAKAQHTASESMQSKEITFKGHGGLELAGTLVVPAGQGPFPAVLLLSGSGPTDRDGNQPPMLATDLHKQLAEALGQAGIASLRFDKRAVARYRSDWPMQNLDELGEFFSWDAFLGDADAAFVALGKQPGIDPARMGVLGHSEGGLYALAMAEKRPVKALVLAAAPGRNLGDVIRDQIGRQVAAAPWDEAKRKSFLAANDAAIRSILDTGKPQADMPAELAPLYNASALKLLQVQLVWEPTEVARKVTAPALVINGEKDVQVSPKLDAEPLHQALAGPKKLMIVPGASHNFKVPKDASDPGFAGPVAAEASRGIVEWLTQHLSE